MDTNSPHKHTLPVRYNILKLTKNKYFSFKGAQPATRYEMASVVARALAKVDAEKASKQDLEMLKKLVMEFKDELDALGVKVDKIDNAVTCLFTISEVGTHIQKAAYRGTLFIPFSKPKFFAVSFIA